MKIQAQFLFYGLYKKLFLKYVCSTHAMVHAAVCMEWNTYLLSE